MKTATAKKKSAVISCASEDEHDPKPVTVLTRAGSEFIMPAAQFAIGEAGKNAADCEHLTIVYVIQANSLQQAQTEFVSTVSHELRTPLTSIKGFADTILRAGDRLDVNQQRRYVGIIKDQADRLTRLVEDILAVSRLESKKLQLTIRAIDLKEAIDRVIQNLADKGKNHKLSVQVPAGLTPVWGDADRLEQILTQSDRQCHKIQSSRDLSHCHSQRHTGQPRDGGICRQRSGSGHTGRAHPPGIFKIWQAGQPAG
jgi:light-regulated signal transduction histidine kinase (bacteriophytochrome)